MFSNNVYWKNFWRNWRKKVWGNCKKILNNFGNTSTDFGKVLNLSFKIYITIIFFDCCKNPSLDLTHLRLSWKKFGGKFREKVQRNLKEIKGNLRNETEKIKMVFKMNIRKMCEKIIKNLKEVRMP